MQWTPKMYVLSPQSLLTTPVLDPVITAAPSVPQATSFSFHSSSPPLTADIWEHIASVICAASAFFNA